MSAIYQNCNLLNCFYSQFQDSIRYFVSISFSSSLSLSISVPVQFPYLCSLPLFIILVQRAIFFCLSNPITIYFDLLASIYGQNIDFKRTNSNNTSNNCFNKNCGNKTWIYTRHKAIQTKTVWFIWWNVIRLLFRLYIGPIKFAITCYLIVARFYFMLLFDCVIQYVLIHCHLSTVLTQ